jgi:hypothetical protein
LRLEPLHRIRFTYPESWMVGLDGGWEQHLLLAEGRCEGAVSGRFRGSNFPRRLGKPPRAEVVPGWQDLADEGSRPARRLARSD